MGQPENVLTVNVLKLENTSNGLPLQNKGWYQKKKNSERIAFNLKVRCVSTHTHTQLQSATFDTLSPSVFKTKNCRLSYLFIIKWVKGVIFCRVY